MNNEKETMPDATATNQEMPASTAYAEAYAVLNSVADKLRQAGPGDIDSLIADYRRAMAAYRICADRLDLIRRELDVELDAAGFDPAAARGSRSRTGHAQGSAKMEGPTEDACRKRPS